MNSNNRVSSKRYQQDTQALKFRKISQEINNMSSRDLTNSLKAKSLPVFGTMQQKRDRLRNHYGIATQTTSTSRPTTKNKALPKDTTREAIDKINKNREKRRKKMEEK